MRAETSVPINEVIATRRSPRSFDSSHILAEVDLRAGLEAARWAPSAFNGQPWRFYSGLRGDALFSEILSSLGEFNQLWAQNASSLILVASTVKKPDGSDHAEYLFDCGLAVGQMVNALCGPVMYLLNMTGHEQSARRTMTLAALANALGNLVLIPWLGIEGSAWATTGSMVFWNAWALVAVYRKTGIRTLIFWR